MSAGQEVRPMKSRALWVPLNPWFTVCIRRYGGSGGLIAMGAAGWVEAYEIVKLWVIMVIERVVT